MIHCFFEQSGTFKNEFKKLGYCAEDYDIRNDFGETDHIVDLFKEIEGGWNEEPSIFDKITQDDIIMAFFPCVRFENQIMLSFRGQSYQMKNWSMEQKMLHDMKLQAELTHLYNLVNKLFLICIRRKLKLIVENPYSEEHYLRRYWCLQPSVIDKDRRIRGDYFRKPTQYWFVNCEPKHNFIFEAINNNAIQTHGNDAIRLLTSATMEKETGIKCNHTVARSMIHPDYANRFIREYIIDNEGCGNAEKGEENGDNTRPHDQRDPQ